MRIETGYCTDWLNLRVHCSLCWMVCAALPLPLRLLWVFRECETITISCMIWSVIDIQIIESPLLSSSTTRRITTISSSIRRRVSTAMCPVLAQWHRDEQPYPFKRYENWFACCNGVLLLLLFRLDHGLWWCVVCVCVCVAWQYRNDWKLAQIHRNRFMNIEFWIWFSNTVGDKDVIRYRNYPVLAFRNGPSKWNASTTNKIISH